jgi:hypothetical protein
VWEIILYLNFATVAGFLLLCAAIPWAAAAVEGRTDDLVPAVSRVLLAICLLVVLAATLLPTQSLGGGERYVTWVPGEGLWGDEMSTLGTGGMEQEMVLRLQLANALMFVPLGLLLAFVTRRPRLGSIVVICLTLGVLIEAAQYGMNAGRTVDVDDVLFNTIGGLLGGVLAVVPRRILVTEGIGSQRAGDVSP